jgi:hypothetical protein
LPGGIKQLAGRMRAMGKGFEVLLILASRLSGNDDSKWGLLSLRRLVVFAFIIAFNGTW